MKKRQTCLFDADVQTIDVYKRPGDYLDDIQGDETVKR
jgi:hypothetical protein